jgi:GTP diphosphokinase / guanosine-3',5'-bis(diphosphate) 3'-diphosphatase
MANRSGPRTPRRSSNPRTRPVAKALRFALEAHTGQTRKDRRTEYIVHPVAVMRVLSSELGVTDPEILSAALLHDTLEDTPTTASELRARFGPRVARWVEELTVPPQYHGPTVPDSVKVEVQVRAAGQISWSAVLIKLADLVDNLRDSANALWSPQKRRAYRDQARKVLKALAKRIRSDRPRPHLARPLRGARRLVRRQLRPSRSEA